MKKAMRVEIRSANVNDFGVIQKLNGEVFKDNFQYDQGLNLNWPQSKTGRRYYQKVLASKRHCCLVAEIDGRAVGYLIGSPRKWSYMKQAFMEIDNMGVSPEYRSRGIGTQLIRVLKNWAKEHGYEKIYVNAYADNQRAIRFYRRQGLDPFSTSLSGKT